MIKNVAAASHLLTPECNLLISHVLKNSWQNTLIKKRNYTTRHEAKKSSQSYLLVHFFF